MGWVLPLIDDCLNVILFHSERVFTTALRSERKGGIARDFSPRSEINFFFLRFFFFLTFHLSDA